MFIDILVLDLRRNSSVDSKYEGKREVAQSCPTLCYPMDCSPPGSSVHRIFRARVLEWVAISFSRASSPSRNQTRLSSIVSRCFTVWASGKSIVNIMSLICWVKHILRRPVGVVIAIIYSRSSNNTLYKMMEHSFMLYFLCILYFLQHIKIYKEK